MARRALCLLLLAALGAPALPSSLRAEEEPTLEILEIPEELLESVQPPVELLPEEPVPPREPEPCEAEGCEKVVEEVFLEDTISEPQPLLFSLPQEEAEPTLLFDQRDSSQAITFSGAYGYREHYLRPAPRYTALASGEVAKVRLYLARNDFETGLDQDNNHIYVSVHDLRYGSSCTLFNAVEKGGGAYTENFDQVPVGDDSAVALVEFGSPMGDCVLEAGVDYEVRLYNRVPGPEADVNGTLYTRGADESSFFLQATADEFPLEESELCAECASNVLFLPGIKGSRLYVGEEEEEKVWDPLGNEDIRALFLDEDGRSVNEVYAKEGDILDTVGGFVDFYGGFLATLASLANDGSINDWEAVAYDWRLSLDDLVENGALHDGRIYYSEATSTPYIEQTLRSLARSSKTGKVTIVAHSNGGLVTKALLQKLGDDETSALVDKVVFVGVPQSGAPQALGALLFGYKEGLPWWFPFMVSPSTAREMAENSPMGYHLLPTDDYFDAIASDDAHQVARFNASTLYPAERAAYGETIDSVEELSSYLLAKENGRTKPLAEAYEEANVLNPSLVAYSTDAHADIDEWRPPAGVDLYQVAGWGEDTISGVEFYEECVSSGCKAKYRPIFVEDGDGVVPVPSALMVEEGENVERYWVDLESHNEDNLDRDHGDIFEIEDLQNFVSQVITNGDSFLSEFIVDVQPEPENQEKKLLFVLHSPLTLELYDDEGNRSGPNEDGSEDEEIPGSQYGRFGETQYIIAPAGDDYLIEMHGTGSGSFSLDIQEIEGGEVTRTTTTADLPATSNTFAQFSISSGVDDVSPIVVDENGDGISDLELTFVPGEITEPVEEVLDTESENTSSSGGTGTSIEKSDYLNPLITSEPPPTPRIFEIFMPNKDLEDVVDHGSANLEDIVPDTQKPADQTASAYDAVVTSDWFSTVMQMVYTFIESIFTWFLKLKINLS